MDQFLVIRVNHKKKHLPQGPFKNDVTGVEGEGIPKISGKKWHRGYMQKVTSPLKKIMHKFFFCLFFIRAAAAELCLAFRWSCCFKHQPESTHIGYIAQLKFGTQIQRLVLKSTLIRRLGTVFIDLQTCCWFIS